MTRSEGHAMDRIRRRSRYHPIALVLVSTER